MPNQEDTFQETKCSQNVLC